MARILAALVLALVLPGCAWTVRGPAAVADPVPVWISEYGKHCRVAVPSGRSTFIEYGFGEWNFYAREKRDIFSILRAGSGFGAGALSRRELIPAPDGTLGPWQTGGTRSESLLVERSRAESLRSKLDARWQANRHSVRQREIDGVVVSRDPARYHVFRNSNHATAEWLRELGCDVRGFPLLSNFRVAR
jgi:hypothetical protein